MATCTFFGHADAPATILPRLREAVVGLIEKWQVTDFYVGTHGAFDRAAHRVLKELAPIYPSIRYTLVLSYHPTGNTTLSEEDLKHPLLPAGLENLPPRFAIVWRNKWMLQQADYVITYVTHSWGGAAKFKELAEKQGKHVLNLCAH